MADERDLLFISYAHADRPWLEKLNVVLKPYARDGVLRIWADQHIQVGTLWQRQIDAAIERTRVALLLVSPDFEASDFVATVELPALLEAWDRGQVRLVIAPLKDARLTSRGFARLNTIQWPVPRDRSLESLRGDRRTRALNDIAAAVHDAWLEATEMASRTSGVSLASTAPAAPPRQVPPLQPSRNPRPGELYGAPPLTADLLERNVEVLQLRDRLFADSALVGVSGTSPQVGVHGPGGIGKTVLTRMLVERLDVRSAFPDGIYWITLGQDADRLAMQTALLQQVTQNVDGATTNAAVHERLEAAFRGKRALLVLDDVWNAQDARAFDVLSSAGRLLITTRDSDLLRTIGASHQALMPLSRESGLELLALRSGYPIDRLPPEAEILVKESGGLPLALGVLAALAKQGVTWPEILAALRDGDATFGSHPDRGAFTSLRAGARWLRGSVAQRYNELAIFPEDARIPAGIITRLWMRTGNLSESRAIETLRELDQQGLLSSGTESDSAILLHDLQHDFATLALDDARAVHAALLHTYAGTTDDADLERFEWADVSRDDTYLWTNLGHHLHGAGLAHVWRRLLIDPEWLIARLRVLDISSLFAHYDAYLHDPLLQAVAAGLKLSAHVLVIDPDQLPGQLVARLSQHPDEAVGKMLASFTTRMRRPWLRPIRALLSQTTEYGSRILPVEETPSAVGIADGRVTAVIGNTLHAWRIDSGEVRSTSVVEILPGEWLDRGEVVGPLAILWSSSHVWVVDALTGNLCWTGAAPTVSRCTFLDGSNIAIGLYDGTVEYVDFKSGRRLHVYPTGSQAGADSQVTAMAASPSHSLLFIAHYGQGIIVAVDWRTCRVVRTFAFGEDCTRGFGEHRTSDCVVSLKVSTDGQRLVAGTERGCVEVWDIESGASKARCRAESLKTLEFLDTSTSILVATISGLIDVWEVSSQQRLATIGRHFGLTSLAVDPVSRTVATTGGDGAIRLWNPEHLNQPRDIPPSSVFGRVAVARDGSVIACSSDFGEILVRHGTSGAVVATFPENAFSMAFDETGQLLAMQDDRGFQVVDWATARVITSRRVPGGIDAAVGGGIRVAGTMLAAVMVGGGTLRWLRLAGDRWTSLRFYAVYLEHGLRRVWHRAATLLRFPVKEWVRRRHVAVSWDGEWTTSTSSVEFHPLLHLWRRRDATLVRSWQPESFRDCAVSSNGRILAAESSDTALILSPASDEVCHVASDERHQISKVAITRDGHYGVGAGHDGWIQVWDLEHNRLVARFAAEDWIEDVAVSDAARTIAAAGDECTILRLEGTTPA